MLEIIKARYSGYCSGVKQAIIKTEKYLKTKKRLYSLGEIVHNPNSVKLLEDKGLKVVDNIEKIPSNANVIVRTHGLPFNILSKLKKNNINVIDGCCPRVKRIHNIISDNLKKDKNIILIGRKNHAEVLAASSYDEKRIFVIEEKKDIESLPLLKEYVVVVQTTFSPEKFSQLTGDLILKIPHLEIFNTLCDETLLRQKEVKRLSSTVDLVIVVGGKNSSNTRTLFEIAKDKAKLVTDPDEVLPEWLKKVNRVAVVSGASTPVEDVNNVVRKIKNIYEKFYLKKKRRKR